MTKMQIASAECTFPSFSVIQSTASVYQVSDCNVAPEYTTETIVQFSQNSNVGRRMERKYQNSFVVEK